MLTEDYFMRMINQMLAVLTQILYHKEAGQYQEAQILIDQSLEQLLGVRAVLLKQMDDPSVLHLLTTQGELVPDRLAMVADLYKLEGDLLADQNQNHEALLDYQRALAFYLKISLVERDQGSRELDNKIDDLYQKLSGHELPTYVLYQLFDYYERQGDYARVEDQISGLLNKNDQMLEILPGIITYYATRLEMSDQELMAGGISRAEVKAKLDSVNKIWQDNE
jgi:tetratricopeptide (TPR) repeat protein